MHTRRNHVVTALSAALLLSVSAHAGVQQLPQEQIRWETPVAENRKPLQPYPGSGTPPSNRRTERVHIGMAEQDEQFWEDRLFARAEQRGKAGRYAFTTQENPDPARQGAAGTGVISVFLDEGEAAGDVLARVAYTNVTLVDPEQVDHQFMIGRGHLVYQIDDQDPVATAAPRLELTDLEKGEHTLTVSLVTSDGTPTGAWQRVRFTVP